MDQDAFRATYKEVNQLFCAFEKSVLTNQCTCSQAEKFCIAEREGVRCAQASAQARCIRVLALLREQAKFALRGTTDAPRLPHGKAMRIQVGGMRGIRDLLDPGSPANTAIDDVDSLLARAEQQFGALERLPFSRIMPQIAAYHSKHRARRRQRTRE
jgi:hypothetical protein